MTALLLVSFCINSFFNIGFVTCGTLSPPTSGNLDSTDLVSSSSPSSTLVEGTSITNIANTQTTFISDYSTSTNFSLSTSFSNFHTASMVSTSTEISPSSTISFSQPLSSTESNPFSTVGSTIVTSELPSLNRSEAYRPYWLVTVILTESSDDINGAFLSQMENNLACAYNLGLQRTQDTSGPGVSFCSAGTAMNGNITLEIINITQPSTSSRRTNIIYYFYIGENITEGQEAIQIMERIDITELALILRYPVVQKVAVFDPVPVISQPNLWWLGVVIPVGILVLVIVIWLLLCIYFKCTRPPKVRTPRSSRRSHTPRSLVSPVRMESDKPFSPQLVPQPELADNIGNYEKNITEQTKEPFTKYYTKGEQQINRAESRKPDDLHVYGGTEKQTLSANFSTTQSESSTHQQRPLPKISDTKVPPLENISVLSKDESTGSEYNTNDNKINNIHLVSSIDNLPTVFKSTKRKKKKRVRDIEDGNQPENDELYCTELPPLIYSHKNKKNTNIPSIENDSDEEIKNNESSNASTRELMHSLLDEFLTNFHSKFRLKEDGVEEENFPNKFILEPKKMSLTQGPEGGNTLVSSDDLTNSYTSLAFHTSSLYQTLKQNYVEKLLNSTEPTSNSAALSSKKFTSLLTNNRKGESKSLNNTLAMSQGSNLYEKLFQNNKYKSDIKTISSLNETNCANNKSFKVPEEDFKFENYQPNRYKTLLTNGTRLNNSCSFKQSSFKDHQKKIQNSLSEIEIIHRIRDQAEMSGTAPNGLMET